MDQFMQLATAINKLADEQRLYRLQHCPHVDVKHHHIFPKIERDQLLATEPDLGLRIGPVTVECVTDPWRRVVELDHTEECAEKSELDNLPSCTASNVGGPTDTAGSVSLKCDKKRN